MLKRNRIKILAGASLGFLGALTAQATDYSWNNVVSYQGYENAANWLPSGVPTSLDNIITPTQYGAPILSGDNTVGNFTVNLNGAWTLSASAVDAKLIISGDLTRTGGNTLNFRNSAVSDGYAGAGNGKLDVEILGNLNSSGTATNFGTSAAGLNSLKVAGTTTISSTLGVNTTGSAEFLGGITFNNSAILYVHRYAANAGGISATKLDSTSTTTGIRASDFEGSIGTLTISGGAGVSGSFAGTLNNYGGSATTSTLAVIKTGVGSQEFKNGNSNYSGGTIITQGTLIVSNTAGSGLGKGNVEVQSNGILAGTGIIAPDADKLLTVAGKLSPGNNGTGTLSFNLSGTSKLEFQLGSVLDFTVGTSSDLIKFTTVGDFLSGSGSVTLALSLGAGFDYNSTYTIFENAATAGFTLAGVTGYDSASYAASWTQVGSNYQVSFTAVPEPSVVGLALGGAVVVLLVARRARVRA